MCATTPETARPAGRALLSASSRTCWPTRSAAPTTTMLMLAAALGASYTAAGGGESGMAALVVSGQAVKSSAVIPAAFALLGSADVPRGIALGCGAGVIMRPHHPVPFGSHVSSSWHVLHDDARLQTPNDIRAGQRRLRLGIRTRGWAGSACCSWSDRHPAADRVTEAGNWLENAAGRPSRSW